MISTCRWLYSNKVYMLHMLSVCCGTVQAVLHHSKMKKQALCEIHPSNSRRKRARAEPRASLWSFCSDEVDATCSHMTLPKASHMTMCKVSGAGSLILLQGLAHQGVVASILTITQSSKVWSQRFTSFSYMHKSPL